MDGRVKASRSESVYLRHRGESLSAGNSVNTTVGREQGSGSHAHTQSMDRMDRIFTIASNSQSSSTSSSISTGGGGSGMPCNPSKKGKLKKKSGWGSWKESWFVLENGMLLELKHEQSSKPNKVYILNKYSIKLADSFTGVSNSFGLFSAAKDSLYLQASSEPEMIEWVTAIGTYCQNAELEWKADSVLEAMNDAMIISNPNGIIIGVNEAALRMFGYTRSEMMGQSVEITMPSTVAAEHGQYIQRFNETNERRLIGKPRKMTAIRKGGEPFPIELSLGLITSPEGQRFAARLRYETDRRSSASVDNFGELIDKSLSLAMDQAAKTLKELLMTEIDALAEQVEQFKIENQKLKSKLRTAKRSAKVSKAAEEPSSLRIPLDLSKIVVNERLAKVGGSGAAVHLATVDGWQCAMKELELSTITSYMLERFESEICLLESLPPHRNLVRYLFHQKTSTKLRLFMTRYSTDLASYLKEKREEKIEFSSSAPSLGLTVLSPKFSVSSSKLFAPKEIVKCALDVATGVLVLHDLKIMHRDLKSDNIFITFGEQGNIDSLAVGDFDTAKHITESTGASTIIGTPGYIAPEVFGRENYSYAADVYSFGVVMYELITLQRPPNEEGFFSDPKSVAKKIIDQHKLSDAYKGIIKIMINCLHSVPEKRSTLANAKEQLLKQLFKL